MSNLLQQHPEIKTFDKDRFVLAASAANYFKSFKENNSQIYAELESFRKAFEQVQTFNEGAVADLFKTAQAFTYTNEQAESLTTQAKNIVEKLNNPFGGGRKVPQGLRLDINKLETVEPLTALLEEFGAKIISLPEVTPLKLDLSKLGRLHKLKLFDPFLQGKVASVHTLDVTGNPGLSIKDIMAWYMLKDGIKAGKLKKGQFIVEGTSGNTGAGLAIAAASLGYKIILTIPDKQSNEKIERLRQLGAHVVVTPSSVAASDPRSYYSVRDTLTKMTKGWKSSQYDNPANTKAHYEVTGPQLWEESEGKVDVLIATMGTCGTISGTAKYLKEKNPKLKVIGVDTVGSILYLLKAGYTIEEVGPLAISYIQQGFGEDIHPANFNAEVVDVMLRVSDVTGLNLARLLPALGVLPGQSSGAVYAGLLEGVASGLIMPKDNVWLLMPDTGVPYRKDVYSDVWMQAKNLYLKN